MSFSHYISAHKDSNFVIKYTLYALGPIPWVEHLHLFHGPTTDTFYALKQTVKCRRGWGMIGLGIARAMKNWEFSKTVKLLQMTEQQYPLIISKSTNNSRQAVNMIGEIYYNNEFNIDLIQDLADLFNFLNNCFQLVVTKGSEHRPNTRMAYSKKNKLTRKH